MRIRDGHVAARQRTVGSIFFPENAGVEIHRRRQMNRLKARLEQAVKQEKYEEAARLRDQIADEKRS